MPWSEPIAEPVGIIVGAATGEIASHYAGRVAKWMEWDAQATDFLMTTAAHFVGNFAASAVVHVATGDFVSLLAINPFTAAAAATAHGAVKTTAKAVLTERAGSVRVA